MICIGFKIAEHEAPKVYGDMLCDECRDMLDLEVAQAALAHAQGEIDRVRARQAERISRLIDGNPWRAR
jgi:hypothetical protein